MDIALFSPSSLFADGDSDSADEDTAETCESFVERTHQFPGMELLIREFSFHQLNANLLWPGTFAFAEWLIEHPSWIEGRRCIELGSGTGALAIFLRKALHLDITTSDYNDQEIEDNIAHNCKANGITPILPHIKHSWGDPFPIPQPDWDLVIASDILLYVKQYPNLIKSLSFLLKSYKPKANEVGTVTKKEQNDETMEGLPRPAFLMSWRRRIGKQDEWLFFSGCENAGLEVKHLGSRVYCIKLRQTAMRKPVEVDN
ncbi:Methyltransferase family protein [Melia azedarach]|uniref:Methyltransferase family protein n=1 Tax=Melia azedarach TaxID=155640 RepID=A0ACC1X2L0_MELAZ|nr:Methyltransferase family protein [Melia azedarach]